MKVNVLTVNDVKISRFRWWSNWIDIAVFDSRHGSSGYLLQMKVSRFNAKRFKAVALNSLINCAHPSVGEVGDLTQMGSGE